MESKRKILFVINPISGTGKKKIIEKLLEEYLDKSAIEFEIKYTEFAGHAIEISKKVVDQNNYECVIAVGGDGSVNEVANGLIGSKVILGIIPVGSGNGFARHMKIPLNLKDAIIALNKGRIQTVDTGKINNHKFVGIAGAGFDAHISKKFDEASTRGFWTYFKLTVSEYLKYKERAYEVKIREEESSLKALILCFCNSSQWGNNAFIAPNANASDGKIVVAIVRKMPLLAVPYFAYRLFKGKVNASKYYRQIVVDEISVKQKDHLIHIDGDPLEFKQTFTVKVNPSSLNVITV